MEDPIMESENSTNRVAQMLEERMSALERMLLIRHSTMTSMEDDKSSAAGAAKFALNPDAGSIAQLAPIPRNPSLLTAKCLDAPTSLSDEIARYFFEENGCGDEPDSSVLWFEPIVDAVSEINEEPAPTLADQSASQPEDEMLVDLHKKLSDMSAVIEVYRQRSQQFQAFDVQDGEAVEGPIHSPDCDSTNIPACTEGIPVAAIDKVEWLMDNCVT
ncbi:unnamed protein product, partial [Symbiodinium microadriaticum]